MIEDALRYVRDFGFAVFPVRPDKTPYLSNGLYGATQEEAILRTYFAQWPDAGLAIACGASGLVVVDLDTKNGKDGIAEFERLCEGREPITTATASTPSGGRHLYFTAPDLCDIHNSASILADGVDIRGEGGYVVAPPTPGYSWIIPPEDGIAALPGWLCEALLAKSAPEPRPAPKPTHERRNVEPYIVATIRGEVENVRAAQDGNRNDTLNKAAYALARYSEIQESEIMSELLIATTLPEREARKTIASGIAAGRKERREIPERSGAAVASKSMDTETQAAHLPWATLPESWISAHVPPRAFVFEHALPVGCVSLLISMGGLGKSTLALIFALSVATGKELLAGFTPTQRGGVAIVSLEDDMPELHRRLQRIARAHGLGPYDEALARDNLRFLPVTTFATIANDKGALIPGKDLDALRNALTDFGPRLVILDPLAALLGGSADENDNGQAQAIVGIVRDAMPPDAGVLLAAHVSKMERELSVTARGASAWGDAARNVLALRPLDTDERKNVDKAETHHYVALEMRKSNYAPMRPTLYLRRDANPATAGALSVVDFGAMKNEAATKQDAAIRAAILDVLPTLGEEGVTRREAAAQSEGKGEAKEEAKARGDDFRDRLTRRAGFNVTSRLAKGVITAMLEDGSLTENLRDRRKLLTLGNVA